MLNTRFKDYVQEHLNESIKGIPSDVLRMADGMNDLVKLFNKDATKIFGKPVDLKKCKFEPSAIRIMDNILKLTHSSKIEKPRAFLVCADYGDEGEETASYCIFKDKGYKIDFSNDHVDTNEDEIVEFYRIANSGHIIYEVIVD